MSTLDETHVTAGAAARLLKIDVRTLYAYVSRGWIRSIPSAGQRARRYARSDIDRLRARQRARAGHGAAAAGALRWGEPVLESSITDVQSHAIRYRGRDLLTDLVNQPFELVAEWLWTGASGFDVARWSSAQPSHALATASRHARPHLDPKDRLAAFVAALAIGDTATSEHEEDLLATARSVLVAAAPLVAGLPGTKSGRGIAATLAAGWRSPVPHAALQLNAALVICADHELNPSTFVARVAASNGARLMSCIEAALATHRGTRQGLAADLLEDIVDQASTRRAGGKIFEAVLERHGAMPGFGHPLYADGDPRGAFLLAAAMRIAPRNPRVAVLTRLVNWASERLNARPNLDCGLVALSVALALPPRSASTIYSVGRIAGWVAHIIEQREMKFRIRPRARYVAAGERHHDPGGWS